MAGFSLDEKNGLNMFISAAEEIISPENTNIYAPENLAMIKNSERLNIVIDEKNFSTVWLDNLIRFNSVWFDNLVKLNSVGVKNFTISYNGKIHHINFPENLPSESIQIFKLPYYFTWDYDYSIKKMDARAIHLLFAPKYISINGQASGDYIRHIDYCDNNTDAKYMIAEHVSENFSDFLEENENKLEISGAVLKFSEECKDISKVTIKLHSGVKWHEGYWACPFTGKIHIKGFGISNTEIREFQIQLFEFLISASKKGYAEAERYMLSLLKENYIHTLKNDRITLENLRTDKCKRHIFTNETVENILGAADDSEKVNEILSRF